MAMRATVTKQAPVVPETIALKALLQYTAGKRGFPLTTVEGIVNDVVHQISEHLRKGDKVRVPKFGTFDVKSRPSRMGRNPFTGETVQLKATKRVVFKMASDLKGVL